MGHVRKVLSGVSLVAIGGLGVVGLIALIVTLGRYPARIAIALAAALVAAVVLGVLVKPFAPRIKHGTILELDLKEVPSEGGSTSKLAALRPSKGLTLSDTIDTLNRASRDKRVAGLILRPHFFESPITTVDELREAIVAFRASGKFAVTIVDSFGEGGHASGAYFLATACDEIIVQETGLAGLHALSQEANFYPDVLARLGIEMEVFGRGKYKSAPNRFTMKKFTPADREQRSRLLESFWAHLVDEVAAARTIDRDAVIALSDHGAQLAPAALEAGLIDKIAYPDEALEEVKARVGKKANLLYLNLYKKRAGKERVKGKSVGIAVIRAVGEIQREDSGIPIGLGGTGPKFGPYSLVPHLRAAVKDKNVKAIVLRIDSPGGSALASDSMWRELVRAREAGKPLVASMASVAASGGYYIAAPADKIVALPSTVTGSIGVFGMRPVLAEAKKKIGMHTDGIYTGSEPPMGVNRKASRAQKKKIDEEIDFTYDTFLKRVADGRNMSIDDVFEVAQGRVWTGADAVEAGLVDELGGLNRALEVAVGLTDAPAGAKAKVKNFPKKPSNLSLLKRNKGENSEDLTEAASLTLNPAKVAHGLTGVQAHLGFDPRDLWMR